MGNNTDIVARTLIVCLTGWCIAVSIAYGSLVDRLDVEADRIGRSTVYTYQNWEDCGWYSYTDMPERNLLLSDVVQDILDELDMSYEYREATCEQDVLVKSSGVTE